MFMYTHAITVSSRCLSKVIWQLAVLQTRRMCAFILFVFNLNTLTELIKHHIIHLDYYSKYTFLKYYIVSLQSNVNPGHKKLIGKATEILNKAV